VAPLIYLPAAELLIISLLLVVAAAPVKVAAEVELVVIELLLEHLAVAVLPKVPLVYLREIIL
tara:strand:+ start:136 stop:324 length:189 start_codon:yes stop_codon:yes gene_type:complete